jgi:hypothetical protein
MRRILVAAVLAAVAGVLLVPGAARAEIVWVSARPAAVAARLHQVPGVPAEARCEALWRAATSAEVAGDLVLAIRLREILADEYLATDAGLESVFALPKLYRALGLGSVYVPELMRAGDVSRPLGLPEVRMTAGRHTIAPPAVPAVLRTK